MKKKIFVFAATITAMFALGLCACTTANNTEPPLQDYSFESLYAQAQTLGYTGTLDDFIELISGKDGIDGKDGKDGADGKDGKDGTDGKDGKDGVGIASVELNENGELVIIGTDGSELFKKPLPLCDHVYSDMTVTAEPGCTSTGFGYKVCSRCGDKDHIALPSVGHSYDDGTVMYDAVCNKTGLMFYTCTECGETKMQVLPATGEHKYKNNVCVYCGVSYIQILDEYYNGTYGYEYLATLNNGALLCRLYDDIFENVSSFHTDETVDAVLSDGNYLLAEINYASLGLTADEAVSVWKTFMDDKPLYYWLSKTLGVTSDFIMLYAEEEYANGETRAEYNENLYSVIDEYTEVAQNMGAYTVALAYHDMIINSIDYAYKPDTRVPESAAWAHNITGVFEGKGAVCEGYARAFQLLLNTRNIQNVFVTGTSKNQAHAWNLVKLDDGGWYWYDLPWDDTPGYYWGMVNTYTCATDDTFLNNHVIDTSDNMGVNFLYELPARATSAYKGDEIMLGDTFTYSGMDYEVIGFDAVNLYCVHNGDDHVIHESVLFDGRNFMVKSIMRDDGRNFFDTDFDHYSITIPATVVFIDNTDLYEQRDKLSNIYVDEDNPLFCSVDGVLFSKNLYTLIKYPMGNPRTEYAIPNETHIIAHDAFTKRIYSPLEVLHIGKNIGLAGLVNWGSGYPTKNSGGNVIDGEWNSIISTLSGRKLITVDEENPNFVITNGMLMTKNKNDLLAGLPNIESVIVPQEVIYITCSAFQDCYNLKSIDLSASNITIISLYAFESCTNLKEVILPINLKRIEDRAFADCSKLSSITLPDSLLRIDREAFSMCSALTQLHIPKNVAKIGAGILADCYNLTEITIANENTYFTLKNNCLIEIETKTLIAAFGDASIPDDGSVTVIGNYALTCPNIETLIIPQCITGIGYGAFFGCKSLTNIVIPSTVNPFRDIFYKYLNIYFEGTAEEWAVLTANSYHTTLITTTYFYSENKPTTTGKYWHYVDGVPTVW